MLILGITKYQCTQHIMTKSHFITDFEVHCYNVIPFGVKNARATYQRLISSIFKEQIGTVLEVYIGVMIVKT
jgi:hypothetical protein